MSGTHVLLVAWMLIVTVNSTSVVQNPSYSKLLLNYKGLFFNANDFNYEVCRINCIDLPDGSRHCWHICTPKQGPPDYPFQVYSRDNDRCCESLRDTNPNVDTRYIDGKHWYPVWFPDAFQVKYDVICSSLSNSCGGHRCSKEQIVTTVLMTPEKPTKELGHWFGVLDKIEFKLVTMNVYCKCVS